MRRFLETLILVLLVIPSFGQSKGDIKQAHKLESQAYEDFDAGKIELSIEKLNTAANIYKSHNLLEEYSNKLQEIAACFSYLEDIDNTIKYFELADEVIIDLYGHESDEHISILYTLVDEYLIAGQTEKVLDSISLIDSYLSQQSSDRADYMVFLRTSAEVLKDVHRFEDAICYYQKLKDETTKYYGENSDVLAQVLIELSKAFLESGNSLSAIKYLSDAKTILEKNGAKGIRYANCLSDLALCETETGSFNNALDFYNTAVTIYADSLGVSSEQYLSTYNGMAQTYIDRGNYKKGVAMAEEVLDLSKGNDILYSTALQNLAYDYSEIGNYKKAIELDSLAIEIETKYLNPQLDTLGRHRDSYALLLNNSAFYYSQLGEIDKAIDITLQSINVFRELYGENYPMIATSFNNLGSYYSSLEKYEEAVSYAKKSLHVLSETEGNNSIKYAAGLNNLAGYYVKSRDYLTAEKLYSESLTILSDSIGEDHPDFLQTTINLSLCYYDEHKYGECLDILLPVMGKLRNILSENFIWMTNSERKVFWEKFSFAFLEELPAVVNKTENGTEHLYDALLLSKGIILNSEINLERIIKNSHSNKLTSIYDNLLDHRIKLLEIGHLNDSLSIQLRDSLKTLVAKEERELVALSTEYGDFTKDLYLRWNEIKENLGKNDIAIEFVNFRDDSDTTYYSALILGKNYNTPIIIHIGAEEELTQFSKYSSNKYAASQLYDLIWGKIYSIVPKNSNIYFSPAGVLHQMCIEYLGDISGENVSGRHTIHRVSSTRYLSKEYRRPGMSAALFGNLNYDLDSTTIANSSLEIHDRNYVAHRGYPGALNNLTPRWKKLGNTKEEIESIAQVLEKKSYKTNLFEEENGTEASFKKLSGQVYAIIHLATHGFFLKVNEAKKTSYYSRQIAGYQELFNPMNRSGILFSGANHSWIGDPLPDYSEDGILLAEEIAVLDFHGTDLLILSACETGLGEVSSEGVSGLQYGFKQAGVNTIVMSLWKVDDEATKILMTNFYKHLLNGETKRQAFDKARESLKKDPRYSNPYYWAAFIMLD